MSERVRSRYPHCLSKGRGVGLVNDGSWKLDPKDLAVFDPTARPRSAFMAPKRETTLSSLVVREAVLSIACAACKRSRSMSALEAVASYGGLITFDELKSLLAGRCRKPPCQVTVTPAYRPWKPLD